MKKFFSAFLIGLLSFSLAACSCSKKEEVKSELKVSYDVYTSSKVSDSFTTQDIYEYIRENDTQNINKQFIASLVEKVLDFSNNDTKLERYELKIKNYFQENFLDNDDYKVNGEFNEDLLASYLETKLYKINRSDSPTSGPTHSLGLEYDYSDFINRSLKYDLYIEILKEDYILNNRQTLLNNSRTRIISVYSTSDLEEMEKVVKKLEQGEYTTLEDINTEKKNDEKEEIGRQYCENLGFANSYYDSNTCSASTNSTTYDSALYKFTVCKNDVRCTPSEGLAYQISLIDEKYKIEEQVVNKDTTDILYEGALEQLFRADVNDFLSDRLLEEGDPFLINGLYNNDEKVARTDIILSSGAGNDLYLVTVRVVDSNSLSIADKEKAFELLHSKVSETTVLLKTLENLKVDITDPELNEYYNTLMGK